MSDKHLCTDDPALFAIKKLAWETWGTTERAKTILGNYDIVPARKGKGSEVMTPGGDIHKEATVGEARQWAQMHFEKRIKAALDSERYDHSLTSEEMEAPEAESASTAAKELIRVAMFHGRPGLRVLLGEVVGDGEPLGDWEVVVRRTRRPDEVNTENTP